MTFMNAEDGDGQTRFLIIIYIFALVLRLIPVWFARDLGIGLDDMFQYDMLARSLAAGHGFRWYAPPDLQTLVEALQHYSGVDPTQISTPDDPRGILTTFRAPLYPAFLALIYRICGLGARLLAARGVQALLTASLAPLTYLLAGQLGGSERWARLSAFAPALWPLLIAFPLGLATENLFIPLLTGGILSLLHTTRHATDGGYLRSGLILGLATLTRSVILGFPFLAGIWLWFQGKRRGAMLLVAMVLIIVLPWSIRNSLLHGQPTSIETSLGYNLYLGYHPEGDGSFIFGPSLDLITILDDAERDQVGRQMAWEFIRADPARVPGLMLRKLGHLWGLEDRAFTYFYSNGLLGRLPPPAVLAIFILLVLPLPILLPAAILGWLSDIGERGWWIPSILLAWYIGVHMLIMAEERFHLALVPLLAALSARGLTYFPTLQRDLLSGKPRARVILASAALLMILAMANWGIELGRSADRLAVLFGPEGASAYFNY